MWMLKVILVRAMKGKKWFLLSWREIYDHKSLGRNNKDALVKPQMEVLLKNEEKAILLECDKELAKLYPSVLWKIELNIMNFII